MKFVKYFEDWQGTIRVLKNSEYMGHYWKHSAKMPERFFEYIRREISPVECELKGNTISIGKFGTKLCEAEMSAGSNMVRTVQISEISIWLSFGSEGDYTSEDGYFNTTINTYNGTRIYDLTEDYRFTSETIEDLCEFLNKIFKEGIVDCDNMS